MTWNNLGPREKQLLAILRRADHPLASREVLVELHANGDDVAYTTVSTILDRLVEKGIVDREEEVVSGSKRYLHAFEADRHRDSLVDSIVEDVEGVLNGPGLDRLARRAREVRSADDETAS